MSPKERKGKEREADLCNGDENGGAANFPISIDNIISFF
jgi:hypothetical protein